MSFRTTFLIIILLVALAGIYFLFLYNPIDDTVEDEKPRIFQVYDLPNEKVTKLQLSYANESFQTLTISRIGNDWEFAAPITAHADSEKVKTLLDDFLNKRVRQTLQVSDYDQYGLSNPTITVKLWKDLSSEPKTFFIGKKGVNYSVYIKEKSEAHVFLIESSALDDMSKSPSDLRDRSLIKFNPNTITEIQFKKPEELQCEKDSGSWKMIAPISVNADTRKIQNILSTLHKLQVSTFETDGDDATLSLEEYGLNQPRIEFTFKDNKNTFGIEIGSEVQSDLNQKSEDKRVFVRSIHQGGISTVSYKIMDLLNTTVFDLRDKRVLDFQRGDTTKFVIQKGTEELVGIKLDKDRWQLNTPNKIMADQQAVSDLLFGLDSLEAVAFVPDATNDLSSYGLNPPNMQVSLSIQGENNPAVFLIGNFADDDTVFVKPYNSDQVVRVKRDLIDNISKGVAWLRDKAIFDFTIEDPTRLTVKYDDEKNENETIAYTCQRLGSNWRLTSPVKENANNTEVNGILYDLIDLKAYEFATGSLKDDITGLNTPQIQITVEFGPKKLLTIQIGRADASGHFYARLRHDPDQVFLLDPEVIPKLKTQLEWIRTTENE